MTSDQQCFLNGEFHRLTLEGVVQRTGIYKKGLSERARLPFQKSLRRYLDSAAKNYVTPVTDAEHCARIEEISRCLSKDHVDILSEEGFRIGPAQKALNLFLKYRWCMGWIHMPPHCPFDRNVIKKIVQHNRALSPECLTWTKLKTIEAYKKLVDVARGIAGPKSLPEWELELWNAH